MPSAPAPARREEAVCLGAGEGSACVTQAADVVLYQDSGRRYTNWGVLCGVCEGTAVNGVRAPEWDGGGGGCLGSCSSFSFVSVHSSVLLGRVASRCPHQPHPWPSLPSAAA